MNRVSFGGGLQLEFMLRIKAHLLQNWRETSCDLHCHCNRSLDSAAEMKRKYSRTTLRRIIKGKRELKIAKSADIAVS